MPRLRQDRAHDVAPMALRILSVCLGVFFLAMGTNKLAWIGEPDLLADRFTRWLPTAAPYARWYLRNHCHPWRSSVCPHRAGCGDLDSLLPACRCSGAYGRLGRGVHGPQLPFRDERLFLAGVLPRRDGPACARRAAGARGGRTQDALVRSGVAASARGGQRGGGAVLARTMSVCGSVTDTGEISLPRRISSRSRTVPSPISLMGCAIVVSGGSV